MNRTYNVSCWIRNSQIAEVTTNSSNESELPAKLTENTTLPLSLPTGWRDVTSEMIYHTQDGRLVKFSKQQIALGKQYDGNNKHLKAIEIGHVPPKGRQGLVPSEKEGFDKKSKVKGKGGNYRFQARYEDHVLYFPGVRTSH